jgi:hypothetical protein
MYARFVGGHTSGKVSADLFNRVNATIKRELGCLYYNKWFQEKDQAYIAVWRGRPIDPELYARHLERNSLAEFNKNRDINIISDVYTYIEQPFNFLQCPFKVGDKVLLGVGDWRNPILFKKGGDKDNVVPKEDCWENAGSTKAEQGKSRFMPRHKTYDGDGGDDYVPAIVKSVSALKVKLEYFKYVKTECVQVSMYNYDNTFVADWSAPRGKIVVGWGSKGALPTRKKYMKEVDTIKVTHYAHPR